jgi:hypothetical protein
MIAINIVAMTNCIGIAVAQYNPSTGQSTSSLSPPSTQSPSPRETSLPPSEIDKPTEPPVVNTSSPPPPPNEQPTKAPVVNSSTISSPPKPVLVGPSNFVASPITSENQENVNTTSAPSKGLFLGSPGE